MAAQVLTEIARKMIADLATGQVNANALDTAKVGLFKTAVSPRPDMVAGDITLCTFEGYVTSDIVVWDKTLVGPASIATVEGDVKEFVCTGDGISETVYGAVLGIFVVGPPATLAVLLAIETFDTPIPISRADQGVRYTPHLEIP